MKRALMIGIALAGIVGLVSVAGVSPALAKASTSTTNIKIPVPISAVWVPCANGGTGEVVVLSGSFHVLFHTTIDSNGGFHSKAQANPQGVKGTGLTTGDKYSGTGVDILRFNGKVGETSTEIFNFSLIGPGPGNNFTYKIRDHVTVNANGEVTVDIRDVTVVCR